MTVAGVKQVVKTSGVSYATVGAHFGKSASWVALVLNGKRACTADQLLKMLEFVRDTKAARDAAHEQAKSELVSTS